VDDTLEWFEHEFEYDGGTICLVCSLDPADPDREVTLEDVLGDSLANVNAVPDWLIGVEAEFAALDHKAVYRSPL